MMENTVRHSSFSARGSSSWDLLRLLSSFLLILVLSVVGGCDDEGGGDADADGDTDVDSDSDSDTDGDVDGDIDADADEDAEIDGGGDADGDVDGDADADWDEDLDADGDVDADEEADADPDVEVIELCEEPQAAVRRVNNWVGDGVQLYVELRDPLGVPDPLADTSMLTLGALPEGEPSFAIEAVEVEAGITAIIMVPSADAEVHAQRVAAARAVIEAMPDGERFILWRLDETPGLMAEFTPRRNHVLERLGSLAAAEVAWPGEEARAELIDDVDDVAGRTDAPSRFIVVVGDPGSLLDLDESPAAVLRLDATTEGLDPCTDRGGWSGEVTPEEAGALLVDHMLLQRSSMVRIGICDLPEGTEGLELTYGDETTPVDLPRFLEAMSDLACVAEEAASDDYPYGDTVELILTPEEMVTWTSYHSRRVEEDFPLHVKIGSSAPIKATAHFRGQGSMGCARKSLNVELDAPGSTRLAPRADANEFYLVSMCLDDGYFQTILGYRHNYELDLFPLERRFVEVRLNETSLGVFMMQEKPTHTLRNEATDMDRMIRRRTGNGRQVEAELKYPNVGTPAEAEALLAEFHELATLAETTAPELIFDTLSSRFDFDNYLRWLAYNTLMRNGDYVDETFFYGSLERTGEGDSEVLYFRNMGWDYDDLNSGCHYGGVHALVDPAGIVYCAEDQIDRSLLLSDEVYETFINHLSEMLDSTIREEDLIDELADIRMDLFAILDNDAACAAMVEVRSPASTNPPCPEVHAAIDARMTSFQAAMLTRWTALRALIDTWAAVP